MENSAWFRFKAKHVKIVDGRVMIMHTEVSKAVLDPLKYLSVTDLNSAEGLMQKDPASIEAELTGGAAPAPSPVPAPQSDPPVPTPAPVPAPQQKPRQALPPEPTQHELMLLIQGDFLKRAQERGSSRDTSHRR